MGIVGSRLPDSEVMGWVQCVGVAPLWRMNTRRRE